MQATIPTELLENVFCEYALPYATKVFPNQELYPEKTPSGMRLFFFTASIPGGGGGKNRYGYDV